ncbi:MAG: DMT family transporter [Bacillota bacterium]|jgi:multidrug transporter EmrE-like cation transporter
MGWFLLFLSGGMEIVWALGLKFAQTFWQYAIIGVILVLCFFPLAKAFKLLPMSIAYAVFTGIGTVGLVLVETFYLQVPLTSAKLIFIIMIIGGMAGLKFVDSLYEKAAQQEAEKIL